MFDDNDVHTRNALFTKHWVLPSLFLFNAKTVTLNASVSRAILSFFTFCNDTAYNTQEN